MEQVTEQQAQVYKSYHGWQAETITTVNGQTYKISTLKTSSGRVTSSAQPGRASQDDKFRSFQVTDMFAGNIKLIAEKKSATEKAIREQHNKAVLLFDEMVQAGDIAPEKPEEIEIGDILFLEGYGKSKGCPENNHVVYDIQPCKWYGKEYLTVEPETLELKSHNGTIKPISKKFGIGTYFEKGYRFKGSQNELNDIVIQAHQKAEEDGKKEAAGKMAEQVRLAKIEEGREKVTIPKGAQAVIVADFYEDKSDAMTDYFSTHVTRTVFLAFSSSKRNNMRELRQAAENWETSKDLLNDESTAEHTGGHSYLPDYYIGSERWSGWKINKRKYLDLNSDSNKEQLYIAAAEGRYFIPEEKQAEKTEVKTTPAGDIQIEEYSDKAIVLRGDTYPIKDDLKELGGRFNYRLKGGPGWIFKKTMQPDIEQFLNL